jgi:Fe-S cluster biogenesis protein NfuA
MTDETTAEGMRTAEGTSDGAVLQTEYPQVDLAVLESTLEYIRPALQADGGDLVLLGVEGGTVNLQMVGACGGCPLSTMTLKAGIERILTERVPGVEEVNAF